MHKSPLYPGRIAPLEESPYSFAGFEELTLTKSLMEIRPVETPLKRSGRRVSSPGRPFGIRENNGLPFMRPRRFPAPETLNLGNKSDKS